jgi:hypothetical protein
LFRERESDECGDEEGKDGDSPEEVAAAVDGEVDESCRDGRSERTIDEPET